MAAAAAAGVGARSSRTKTHLRCLLGVPSETCHQLTDQVLPARLHCFDRYSHLQGSCPLSTISYKSSMQFRIECCNREARRARRVWQGTASADTFGAMCRAFERFCLQIFLIVFFYRIAGAKDLATPGSSELRRVDRSRADDAASDGPAWQQQAGPGKALHLRWSRCGSLAW